MDAAALRSKSSTTIVSICEQKTISPSIRRTLFDRADTRLLCATRDGRIVERGVLGSTIQRLVFGSEGYVNI